jgi:transposase-like protein
MSTPDPAGPAIVEMAMNASGIRDTARVLHVSPAQS